MATAIGGGMVWWILDRLMPNAPWATYVGIAVALIALAPVVLRELFAVENPFKSRRFHGWCFLVVLIFGSSLALAGRGVWFSCMSNKEAHEIIEKYAGKVPPYGRKRAIECLARNGENLRNLQIYFARIGPLKLPPDTRLGEAILVGAQLPGGQFRRAQMSGAILSAANLSGANFSEADLSGAIFGAHVLKLGGQPYCLEGAYLRGTNFRGANLSKAYLYGVKGLTCEQLKLAKNWQSSYREVKLHCGEPISVPPKHVTRPFRTCAERKKFLESN